MRLKILQVMPLALPIGWVILEKLPSPSDWAVSPVLPWLYSGSTSFSVQKAILEIFKGCFICCTDAGVRVFNIEPLAEKCHLDVSSYGSITHAEMLFRTNLIAVVGGGFRPRFSENVILVLDDSTKQFVLQYTFKMPVIGVRLRKDKLIAVLHNQVHVFSFPNDSRRLLTMDTRDNPKALCEVSQSMAPDKQVMVLPGHKVGSLQFLDLSSSETTVSKAPVTVSAHQSELSCIALNQDASMVASASEKGTLIRVWDTSKKVLLAELRRGTDTATVYCINFCRDSEFLCCASDKGTVHIFAVRDTQLNRRSALSKIGLNAAGGYIDSQWALANFTVPPESACVCTFIGKNSVAAICMDGTFHKYIFSASGNCNRESFDIYLDLCEDDDF